jgi:hypothetical protein
LRRQTFFSDGAHGVTNGRDHGLTKLARIDRKRNAPNASHP